MNVQSADFSTPSDTGRRLDQIGWGIFLIMIGAIWLVPNVPQGTWLIGTGALLLALNVLRYSIGLHWSGVTTVLGVVALAAGVGELTGIRLPLFPICLILVGIGLVLKPLIAEEA